MKVRTLAALSSLSGALIMSGSADASYQGILARLHTTSMVGQGNGTPALRSVYRVYIVFSNPGDFVTSIAGSPTLGNITIQSRNSTDTGPGGNFVNPFLGGATAPTFKHFGTQVEWDTFVDIGFAIVPEGERDGTGLSPGFAGIGNVASVNSNNIGWFAPSGAANGMAGNGVANVDGLGNWGVIVMQLTVNVGNHVSGTVAIGGINNNPLAGGTTFQTMANQTFNSFPAPGSLGVLGLAGLMGSRTRKTM